MRQNKIHPDQFMKALSPRHSSGTGKENGAFYCLESPKHHAEATAVSGYISIGKILNIQICLLSAPFLSREMGRAAVLSV